MRVVQELISVYQEAIGWADMHNSAKAQWSCWVNADFFIILSCDNHKRLSCLEVAILTIPIREHKGYDYLDRSIFWISLGTLLKKQSRLCIRRSAPKLLQVVLSRAFFNRVLAGSSKHSPC